MISLLNIQWSWMNTCERCNKKWANRWHVSDCIRHVQWTAITLLTVQKLSLTSPTDGEKRVHHHNVKHFWYISRVRIDMNKEIIIIGIIIGLTKANVPVSAVVYLNTIQCKSTDNAQALEHNTSDLHVRHSCLHHIATKIRQKGVYYTESLAEKCVKLAQMNQEGSGVPLSL